MGHRRISSSRAWKRPSLKNARSFLIKLVQSQPSAPQKGDGPTSNDTARHEPEEDGLFSRGAGNLPPTYEVAIQTPSHIRGRDRTNLSDELQERLTCSTTSRTSMIMKNASYSSSIASSAAPLPRSPIQAAISLPTATELEETEEIDLSYEQSIPRLSSQQTCSSTNPCPSKKAVTYKVMKASSTGGLNSLARRATNGGRSSNRRDKELIAAKRSLPILTKFGKPSNAHKNVTLI
ncbi:hypothetical protein MJO28_012476 [Puccinia striiformis f. sp. tritici]|uniref:Uncharacterized protein n=2 Tax=Puccinia striiformis TaxID=27350 RepID=A0A2S4W964_9BASI|nr:hypothetical protein Pst134EA_022624 [Puccinia striiformis f. sp. tritici]KAI9611339.1 hypothetical protein KEM48_004489 [Puccinia striiformis f. sp. tritici PST-130]POW18300.1 hypothetical protein PSHT_05988 [Puccinia striiformis]KAH9455146.1 hypothetical protein Pst134EA_022624 [Puccinia striiformis f. sp. tritici]KAI7942449.1 hypothetical protein MJO28_012476 [Puccinia striiformis f. sp. tritici]KAI7945554.1 hypothetical protein MJO29_011942 [Puccinia striiformis f. sp. tritici]